MLLNFHINYFTDFKNGRDDRLRGQRGLSGCVAWRGWRGGGAYEVINKSIWGEEQDDMLFWVYDSIATVGEIRVYWRADFQSGSSVLKKVLWTFFIYIYGIQCDFMQKKVVKTIKFWKSLNRDLLKFLNWYGIFWVPPGVSSCPDGSEYVWQRGVESL